jgi:protocatechuate 3,4-dioxygenase beta subunit
LSASTGDDRDDRPIAGPNRVLNLRAIVTSRLRQHLPAPRARDPNFEGYGRCTTGTDGRYPFRALKPVPYPGRAPHIHFAASATGRAIRWHATPWS